MATTGQAVAAVPADDVALPANQVAPLEVAHIGPEFLDDADEDDLQRDETSALIRLEDAALFLPWLCLRVG